MLHKIIWSQLAQSDLLELTEYLMQSWGKEIALKYIDLIEAILFSISEYPKQYPVINKRLQVRKCVISKYNSLYYRLAKSEISILRIYDNRRNPKTLKFSI